MKNSDIGFSRMRVGNDVFVERQADGGVHIVRASDFSAEPTEVLATFDASTWASMIAFASFEGESADSYKKAVALHGGSNGS